VVVVGGVVVVVDGAVVATLWDAATGDEDEHAARASPATPRARTMLIIGWPLRRRPRRVVERCCLASSTLILPPLLRLQATPGVLRTSR
jgi:hypothetical protein